MDPLEFVRALERREAELREASVRLADAQSTAELVAARAREIEDGLARLPAERAHAEAAIVEARTARDRGQEAVARLRNAADDDESARRLREQAEAALRSAEQRLARAEHDRDALEKSADAVDANVAELEGRAREAGTTLATLSSRTRRDVVAPSGLAALREWAPRARAAAFVARGQVDRERELLIREAAETATSVLGEPFAGASVEVVRRRLAREPRV